MFERFFSIRIYPIENYRDFKKLVFKKLVETGSLGIKPLDYGMRPGGRSKITYKQPL